MADISPFFTTSDGTNLAKQYRQLPPIETDPLDGFRQAIADAGLLLPDHIDADGQIHRFSTNGKTGDKAGYYCLHLDGVAAGHFGCWREGIQQNWSAKGGQQLDRDQLDRLRKSMDQARKDRERHQQQRAEVAKSIWDAAAPADPAHPYLKAKGVMAVGGIRQANIDRAIWFDDETKTGTIDKCLLMRADGVNGLQTIQAIKTDGGKLFFSGAAKAGAWSTIPGDDARVYVCEGWATGATLSAATGATVLVAFDSGNLPKVAKAARQQMPAAEIIIAGDNDHQTDENPGLKAAERAASESGASVVTPMFDGGTGTDWNDYQQANGLDAVKQALNSQQAANDDAEPAFGYTMVGDMVTHLKPIDWLIKGYLEADSLGLIYGPPKCGKSFLAIDWACSIATGTPWNGHKVQQGSVFYLAGEGHNGLSRRFASWQIAKGVSLKGAPIAVSNKAAPMVDEASAMAVMRSIEHLAKAHGEPAVIIIDTLARNFGADENSTQDMNTFVKHLDEIKSRWKAHVLVVHHTGKDKSRGARGSVALTGAIDAGYSIGRDELGIVSLEPTEMKDAELPEPLFFDLESIKLPMVDEDGNDVFGAALKCRGNNYQPPQRGKAGRGKLQTQALEILNKLYQQHEHRLEADGRDTDDARVTIQDWRAACLDADIKPQRWPEIKRSLADAGLIDIHEPYAMPT